MIYAFADYELDETLFELRRDGERLNAPPKVLDLILYLVRHRQRVVAKEELLTNVWAGTAVTEDSLSQAIRTARRVLNDDAGEQRVIQTVRGRGYHFIAQVATNAAERPRISIEIAEAHEAPPLSWSAQSQRGVFVGRSDVLARLGRYAEECGSGKGRAVLITGDPGIGKTRLLDRFALSAAGLGAEVAVARCYEGEGAPAYWPWTQILRACFESRPAADALRAIGAGPGDIAALLPELRPSAARPKSDGESAQERFQLFETVNRLFKQLTKHRVLVVIIDDWHDADEPSLLLYQYLIRNLSNRRLLLLGTAREAGGSGEALLRRVSGELTQLSPSNVIRLTGLSSDDVAVLVQRCTGRQPSGHCTDHLREQTNGNPLFLTHLMQALVREGRLDELEREQLSAISVPSSLREGISRQLAALPADTADVLTGAAVFGKEFELAALARARKIEPETLLERLAPAEARGLVEVVPSAVPRYRFAHALIREVLYRSLDLAARVRMHASAGEALLELGADLDPERLSELAHHFVQAAANGQIERAIQYSVRAAKEAIQRTAHEPAVMHYERALKTLELGEPAPEKRLELLLGLALAEMRSGELARARGTYQSALQLARSLGDAAAFGEAVLGHTAEEETGQVHEARVRLLQEALALQGDAPSALKARLLGRLGLALYFAEDSERANELAAEAVSMARAVGDERALAQVLRNRHFVLWLPDDAERRLEMATELLALAEKSGERELEALSIAARIEDSLALGDVARLDADIARYGRIARDVPHPFHEWYDALYGAMRAHMRGDFEAAERGIFQAFQIGQKAGFGLAGVWLGVQMFALRREQGRLVELEEPVRNLRAQHPKLLSWRVGAAYLDAASGRTNDAQRELKTLVGSGSTLRRDVNWLVSTVVLAEIAAQLADRQAAQILYDSLAPYARLHVTVGLGIAYYGSVARYLGLLATTLRRWDDAAAHYEWALVSHTRLGARPFTAYTECDYATMLLHRNVPGDHERAAAFLDRALDSAESLGMNALAQKCRRLELEVAGPATRRL